MEKLHIGEIIAAVDGILLSGKGDLTVSSVSTNTRELSSGALFVPIKGNKFNGHDFIDNAFDAGAVATLTAEHDMVAANPDKVYIKVRDTKVALQQLAAYYRKKFAIPVVGVTGSVGKTSTKELIASVLSEKFNVHKTEGNLNGQIGLPLTLLGLEDKHDVAVVEMGISEFNEMETLAKMAKPSHAVITNIGVTHIENLHTRDNIFKEKLKITSFLCNSDYLFINGDDDILCKTQCSKDFNVISFGITNDCMFTAKNIASKNETTSFNVLHDGTCQEFFIPTIGEHNVYNALVAIAVGLSMGMTNDEIQSGLAHFKNINMRQNIQRLGGLTIIDDTYNANPDSMKSALKVLAQLQKKGRKIAVLGDMLELGELATLLHEEIGHFAVCLEVDVVITVGELAKSIASGARKTLTHSFNSNKEAVECLKELIRLGDVVLVKGSRSMHMEEIVQEIKAWFSDNSVT